MKSNEPQRRCAALFVAVVAASGAGLGVSTPAAAQGLGGDISQPGRRPVQWFSEAGVAEDATAIGVGVIRDWAWSWRLGSHAVTGHTELSISRWTVSNGARADGHDGSTRVGLTPIVRWWGGERRGLFAEAGIGVNLIGPTYRTANRRFSTAFNFGDHLGLGWRSGDSTPWDISMRVSHFSNGGIKKPNPGENFVQLRFAATF